MSLGQHQSKGEAELHRLGSLRFGLSRPIFYHFASTSTPYPYPLCLPPTMAHHRGDDLDDDFMPDEIVALSEDEGFGTLGDQDDIDKLLSAGEEEEDVESPVAQAKALLEDKKRKRREKEKERRAKVCPLQLIARPSSLVFLTRDAIFPNRRENVMKLRNQGTLVLWHCDRPLQYLSICLSCRRGHFPNCPHWSFRTCIFQARASLKAFQKMSHG